MTSWTRRISSALILSVAATVALAACEEEPVSPGDPQAAERPPIQGEDRDWQHMYGTWLDIAAEVPGYAGHWKEDGATIVGLTDPASQQAKAMDVFGSSQQMSYDQTTRSVTRTSKARYDIHEIIRWHNEAGGLIGKDDIWGVGLKFPENAINVVITPDADESLVEDRLEALGIPRAGVLIERRQRPSSMVGPPSSAIAARQDDYKLSSRAVGGGLRPGFRVGINRQVRQDASCTLGVVVATTRLGTMLGTNAHCTDYLSIADEGNKLHQPSVVSSNSEVGFESWTSPWREDDDDGPPTQVKCDYGPGCKFSDFSLFELTDMSRNGAVGDIQRTDPPTTPGNITTKHDLYTTMDRTWMKRMVNGDDVVMIGRMTGEVRGVVSNPCFSYEFHREDPDEWVKWLCETEVEVGTAMRDGDSGGPVIWAEGGSSNSPVFLGMVSGGGNDYVIYSPAMDMVAFRDYREKIGAIRFCAGCSWLDPD